MKAFRLLNIIIMLGLMLNASCRKEAETDRQEQEVPEDNTLSDIPCIPNSVRSGIIAFYPFSNGSLNDFSGNGHHLTNGTTAVPAADRSGNPSCAFAFHNLTTAGEKLFTAQTSFLNGLAQFSVSLWYMPEDSSRYGYEVLVCRDSVRGRCPDHKMGQWAIGLYDCRRAVFSRLNSAWQKRSGPITDCGADARQNTGSWHHLVAAFNQSLNNQMILYRDGVLQGTVNGNPGCGSGGPITVQDIGDLILGADYNGRLDDVILYNKTLSQSDVNHLYKISACCSAQ